MWSTISARTRRFIFAHVECSAYRFPSARVPHSGHLAKNHVVAWRPQLLIL